MSSNNIMDMFKASNNIIAAIETICDVFERERIPIKFDINRLRDIGIRACDNKSNTYLWHINGLMHASSDLSHFILGLEIMFDCFLQTTDQINENQDSLQMPFLRSPNKQDKQNTKHKIIHPSYDTTNIINDNIKNTQNEISNEKRILDSIAQLLCSPDNGYIDTPKKNRVNNINNMNENEMITDPNAINYLSSPNARVMKNVKRFRQNNSHNGNVDNIDQDKEMDQNKQVTSSFNMNTFVKDVDDAQP